MAESTKHLPINGGTLISEFRSLFSMFRTRRTMAFAYGFVFVFVAFTAFLAFNPSPNTASPWFTNIFSLSSSNSSSSSSSSSRSSSSTPPILSDDGSESRSQLPSFFSYFFPNSSQSQQQNQAQNFTQNNIPRSDNTSFQSPETPKQLPIVKNQTTIQPPKAPAATASPPSSTKVSSNGEVVKQNKTTIQPPKTPVLENAKNQSTSEVVKQNQTSNQPIKTPVPANQKGDLPKNNSTSSEKKKDGKVEVEKKGAISNDTASLLKKQSNGTNSEVPEKQGKQGKGKGGELGMIESLMNCDLFDGNWVRDDSYPLYKPGTCSLIDEQFNCFLNGRPDQIYQQLKWKPKGCTLPRLNPNHMLQMLKGKRLVFVGDSLNRNMWESLVCILKSAVKDQSKVYEASGRHHFRTEASYSFIFKDYDCTIEFFVSPFLVQEWDLPEKDGSTKETLRLDLIGRSANKYKDADIIIFNTGHWWTHDKTSKGKDYYQEGTHVYGELNVIEAFRKALTTWARWVDANVNPKKSFVFFRGYSASHFSGGQWNSGGQCDSETEPIKNETYLSPYPPKMRVLESVLKGMKTHVSYLNITRITDYRKDGHPSVYRKQYLSEKERKSPLRFQDCSHWCLPGVPDAWNELLYAELLIRLKQRQQQHQQKRP